MTRQNELDLSKHARNALDNPALQSAFASYEAKIVEQLKATDYRDREMLLTLKRHLTSLNVVRRNLEILIADGEEAKAKIRFEQTMAGRAKSALLRIA